MTSSGEHSQEHGTVHRGSPRSDVANLGSAVDDVKRAVEALSGEVKERVDAHPLKALAAALGAGYVIGGGLFSPLTGRLLLGGVRIGLRLAALPLVRDELFAVVDSISSSQRVSERTAGRDQ
jgi:hypothetical protein